MKGRVRRGGKAEATGRAPASVHEVLRSPGKPLDSTLRAVMEPRFGHDFSRVKVHTDDRASRSARDVGALAYTVGSDVVFGAGQYDARSPEGQSLIAHELTHVLQQKSAPGAPTPAGLKVGLPDSPAERAAQSTAAAVLRGETLPDPGSSPGDVLSRQIATNGGTFHTTNYVTATDPDPTAPMGVGVGADITLTFTPNDLVEASTIGLAQTTERLRSPAPGGPATQPTHINTRQQDLSVTPGGVPGPAIDQGNPQARDPDTIPNTNPLYAVENSPGAVSATLTDVGADTRAGRHGRRIRRPDGTFDVREAVLIDRPRHPVQFQGEEVINTFEATALVLDGPMRDTYLGSVEWGWQIDSQGNHTVIPLRMVRAGVPSSELMEAAATWNAATFTDPSTGTAYNTVDLPIVQPGLDSGSRTAAGRTTSELLTWLAYIDIELARLSPGTDRINKEFERRAIEAELRGRNLKVAVRIFGRQDLLGADEVHVKVTSGNHVRSTDFQIKKNNFMGVSFPLQDLMPIGEQVVVEIHEKDVGRLRPDDQIARIVWNRPFQATTSREKAGRADYEVTVEFDR